MAFFPLLKAPGCTGWTTVFNFAPNDWEERERAPRYLDVTWSDGECWNTRNLDRIPHGDARTVTSADLAGIVPAACLALLGLTDTPREGRSAHLPGNGAPATSYPQWRATLGLASGQATTCYQGELAPFPAPGSLLTFGHFMQFGPEIENHLLFLNTEASPTGRTALIEIHNDARHAAPPATFEVRNNCVNLVCLDGLGIAPDTLPVIICRQMSGIPLYFSRTKDGAYLSIEHSHPPASSVILGRRWEAQRLLKQIWFSRTGKP